MLRCTGVLPGYSLYRGYWAEEYGSLCRGFRYIGVTGLKNMIRCTGVLPGYSLYRGYWAAEYGSLYRGFNGVFVT